MQLKILLTLLALTLSQSALAHTCEEESFLYCKDYYTLVDVTRGAEQNTYPKSCQDVVSSLKDNYYCKDYYTIKNVVSEEEQNTYPKSCADVISEMKRGYYCKDYYTLKNLNTGKEQNTYPKACKEIL